MATTMPSQHDRSEACCNIPPVMAKDYPIKGAYEELGGMKTYVTGPADATKAIMVIFDIFGYFPQTLQGADILATSDDHHKYKVFMPDWFEGEPYPIEWYPPDTPEKQQQIGAFFQKNGPATVRPKIPALLEVMEAKYPTIQSWAIIGYCWGGKVVSVVASADDNPFKAAVECHPAMVDPADAAGIRVPLCMLASKDEPADGVAGFEAALSVPNHVEVFADQVHGWMAARGDLEDPRVLQEYTRGYRTILDFLAKHW